MTVRVYYLLKTVTKCTQIGIYFWGKAQPPPHSTPLNAYGASPLLTEILNTPLDEAYTVQLAHGQ